MTNTSASLIFDPQIGGLSAKACRDAGLFAKDCKDAGYSARDCRDAGYTAKDCKDAGLVSSAKDCKDVGYSYKECGPYFGKNGYLLQVKGIDYWSGSRAGDLYRFI